MMNTALLEYEMTEKITSKNTNLNQTFIVGDWLVEPAIERISNGDIEERLEPRVMDLLLCLVNKAGEVVTREYLEEKVWSGMVVGYDSLSSAMNKLRKAFHEDSKHPKIIQTVSKRGYRLIAEIKLEKSHESSEISTRSINKIYGIAFGLGLLIVIGIIYGISIIYIQYPLSQNNKNITPAIIVLPFLNMSDDPKQVYFSDGMTEDIITDLSRISNLQVMARNTSFRYKEKMVKPEEIGKELNVQYLLEGSVRKENKKLRINVQLIDTSNGYHIWSNRYDRKLTEVFAVQDELTRNIVNALAIKITAQEETSLSRISTNNFQAYEYFLQGQKFSRQRTKESFSQAEDEFKKAINIDPTYARSYGSLAILTMRKVTNGWSDSPSEERDRALEMAKKSISTDDTLPQAYWALGFVHLYRDEFNKAIEAVNKAIIIAPSYADGYGLLALINNRLGNADNALKLITKAKKLNPHYSWDYPYNIGRAYYTKKQYKLAIVELKKALERNESAMLPRLFLAASYSALGMDSEAEWEVEEIITVNSKFSISHIINGGSITKQKNMDSYISHLRKAGLPE